MQQATACLVFVCVEKQRFGDVDFFEGKMILTGQFFPAGSPGIYKISDAGGFVG